MSSPLSKYFIGVGAKRLSQVEITPDLSHQHELNGIGDFKKIFGTERKKFQAKFIFISDSEDNLKEATGFLTWYDARERHPTRTEYRLYYSSNEIMPLAKDEDLVIVAQINSEELAVIIAPKNSTSEKQLLWLFGLEEISNTFIVKDLAEERKDIGFAGRYILSTLGFEIEETAPAFLEEMLKRYGRNFPSTKVFSEYARSTIKEISPIEAPDETLMTWIEREELLFKTLEKVIIKEQLEKGFGEDGTDVDEFIKLSLSIQNRRKSRAGFAFENNLAVLFTKNGVLYSHGAVTERNNKPDFVFPGITYYHDTTFNTALLTMLGLKTTAKDRWRQVLPEAEKITHKHLITLEPAISKNQTEEMRAHKLQLVIPQPLLSTYSLEQQKHIITVKQFIETVTGKQKMLHG